MEDKVKVLCVGDVEGRHENLFKTVSRLNAKAGPFAAVLCVVVVALGTYVASVRGFPEP